jgi:uncharacterized protein (TIGR00255 family)
MRSMTGYGHAEWKHGGRSLTVDIRSVNQRFLEVRFNMPREYLPWENELRGLVQEHVARGKVDITVGGGGSNSSQLAVEANLELARVYVDGWRQLQKALNLPGTIDVGLLQGRSELVRIVEKRGDPGEEIATVRDTMDRALRAFNRDREREGQALGKDMLGRVKHLTRLQQQISKVVTRLKVKTAAKLRQRITALLEGRELKEERLMQEVAFLAERSDVTEELVRLESHLDQLIKLLRGDGPIGKKLDFLLQEVHREFNTIASKSADLGVTKHTVEARGEIEKLREQVQNLE